ncbi:hypothetical protein P153DRAFT_297557 [Dothidotthia symphoricarpi CBS 119687]|uniref:Uncharacterized protein n=1 Tax=Dothidotthia symphoricarpi CBS 119687 TaxID=1392245 RepID=A0A6A6A461_9PLEO|nr:uncharacterized protein P153DRAFT_297557 [Dothidotthia symphoricarpi CBS 119687]KAF2126600.1 hypothetical protein P153DRAFT_297557 [Dothidotthia symphoricarpi CBS 119687]
MRSISVLLALLFAFATTSYAFPSPNSNLPTLLYPRKHGNNNNSTASTGRALKKQCNKISKLTKLTSLASNQTKIDQLVAQGRMTTADVTKLQAKAANATITLQSLESNSTLVAECNAVSAHQKDVKQCNQLQRLTSLVALAGNQTILDELATKKGVNETRLEEKLAKAETKLKEMETNTTLTDFCAQRKAQ